MKKERNSTIEFLRIISMLGVVGLHYMNKKIGGGLNTVEPTNILFSHFIESLCITSVNVFVLISGYYLIDQKTSGLRKAIELYLIMLFYHLVFFVFALVIGETEFSLRELAVTIFPFAIGNKWFLETYILLLLFLPFINILISRLNKASHMLLLSLMLMVFSVWSSFLPSPPLTDGGYGITNFITLYLIAAFIRKYVVLPKDRRSIQISGLIFCGSVLLIFIFSFSLFKGRAWDYCFIFNIIASTAIFYLFLNLPSCSCSSINLISGLTFGVYISHSNLHLQNLVYHKIMHTERFVNSPKMFLHFLICVVLQFLAFAIIEFIRQLLWKPTIGKWLISSSLLETEQKWEFSIFSTV